MNNDPIILSPLHVT